MEHKAIYHNSHPRAPIKRGISNLFPITFPSSRPVEEFNALSSKITHSFPQAPSFQLRLLSH